MRLRIRSLPLVVSLIMICGAEPVAKEPRKLVLRVPPATGVDSVAVSPDGTLVATAAGEGGVRLYDAKTGVLLRTIGDVGDRSVTFSPDGQSIAAGGFHMDKLVGIYDVRTGKRTKTLAGHTEWETDSCTFSPDGKLFASTGVDKQILVWDTATGAIRHRLADQPFRVTTLAFSPDSSTLASGGDKVVRLWDMATGRVRQTLKGHRNWVCTVAFSTDGKRVASGSCDWVTHRGHDWPRPLGKPREQSEWRLWDVGSGEVKRTVEEPGRLLSLAIAPDGKSVACGVNNEVRLYGVSADAPVRVLTSHLLDVTSMAFTPDGAAVVSGSHDHTVKRTHIASGKVEWHAPGYTEQVNSVALSQNGSVLVTGSSDGRFALGRCKSGETGLGPGAVRLWDPRTGKLLRRLGDSADQVMAVAVSPDGKRVIAGGGGSDNKGVTRAWDAATGTTIWSVADHESEVLSVAYNTDASLVASGSADGVIKIRDAGTGSVTQTLVGHERGATSLVFSPDGETLVCGAGDGTASLWEVSSGNRVRTFRPKSLTPMALQWDRPITSISLSRDGQTLMTCSAGVNQTYAGPVSLWDVRTGELKRQFAYPGVTGRPMALSPDGEVLATGGKSVRLWDARTGKPLRELFGHLKRTQSFAFSSDGRVLVSGGSYGTTNIWEVETGRHMVTLFAFPPEKRDGTVADEWLAYHPDGYYDGSSGVDQILSWRVGDELLTPETLGPQLHRPDRIAEALKLSPR